MLISLFGNDVLISSLQLDTFVPGVPVCPTCLQLNLARGKLKRGEGQEGACQQVTAGGAGEPEPEGPEVRARVMLFQRCCYQTLSRAQVGVQEAEGAVKSYRRVSIRVQSGALGLNLEI